MLILPNKTIGQSLPGSGNCLTFNGSSTYINCGTADRGIISDLTVEAWIKTTSSVGQFAVTKYSNSFFSESGFEFGTNNGRAVLFGRVRVGEYLSSGFSSTLVNDGRWHHIAGQVAGNVWRIYVDGVLENSTTYNNYVVGDLRTPEPLTIGTYTYLNNLYFAGEIDEVRVWRTARTEAQIRDNMCQKFATVPADLVAYYQFDQANGNVAVDRGSVPTPGTLLNFPAAANWHLSGAPLGDVSASLYQNTWPASSRIRLITSTGDSAIVSNLPAQTRGVHLYAVNTAPTIAPADAAIPSYVGVFTTASSTPDVTFSLRLRPATGPACRNAFRRTSNELPWTLPAQPPITATSLLVQNTSYRSEHILTAGTTIAAAIEGDSVLCAGTSTELRVVAPSGVNFLWNTGATTANLPNVGPGTYTVTVSASSGCSRVLRRTVRTISLPVLAITGDSLICAGASTSLTANATGATAYRWNTGATTATIRINQVGTYSVTATYGTGCTISARRTVRAISLPMLAITGDSLICAGASTSLTANAPGATAYRWSTGATTATVLIGQAGTYSVTATYGTGCTISARRTVRENAVAAPRAFTLGADTTLCEGDQLRLQGPVGPDLRYQWSDGTTSRQLVVQTAGRYTLRVLTACGEQSAARSVAVRSCLQIPNIVTANADGHNDFFAVQGLQGEGWALDVYNRWGRAVWQTANYHNDWGNNAAPGLYYVLLRRPATGYLYKGWVEVVL
ncbi:LamG-like jellyroll fold domain-containing protein [Hymenobacter montanus]|nr:LamG-like jellyroll fold domain-containing protein [Hymenobacter montanus]